MGDGVTFGLSVNAAFFAGVLSFFSPCVLPLVPGYMGYLGGMSSTSARSGMRPSRLMLMSKSSVFVLGFVTVFLLLGLSSSLLGGVLARHLDSLQILAGLLISGLGLYFLGWLPLSFLNRDVRFTRLPAVAGYGGAYITGLAFGFGWTPCVGPVLATILLVVASQPEELSGVMLLTAYGLGLGLPFLFVALFYDLFKQRFSTITRSIPFVKYGLGLLLTLTGIAMMTGWLNELGFWMLRSSSLFGTVG